MSCIETVIIVQRNASIVIDNILWGNLIMNKVQLRMIKFMKKIGLLKD